ncbi:MAG: phosphatase PAP2 family protein [Anaerolineae bacterium]|nr:phosphatase PAP2 family protein [Anaerolineae bacterium]
MMESIWEWGNNLIVSIQAVHNPILDGFFNMITFLGEAEFFLLIFPFIIWTIDKSVGRRLAYLILISIAVNTWAKLLIGHPRPFEWPSETTSPILKLNNRATGPGIPSGHTQSSLTLWFYLAYHFQRFWVWILAVAIFILVSFSRVYLGVHFPTDLLGGAILGLLILMLFIKYENTLTGKLSALPVSSQIGLATALPLLIILVHPHPDTVAVFGVLSGLSLGIIFDDRSIGFEVAGSVTRRALRLGVGLLTLIAIYFGLKFILPSSQSIFHLPLEIVHYAIAGFWASGGAPWLFKRMNLA